MKIHKNKLLYIAASLWMIVGIILMIVALNWLYIYNNILAFLYLGISLIGGIVIYKFGFSKIVNKNITRINLLEDYSNAFKFLSVKSYFLILIMMTMGYILRHSSLPKQYLSIIYFGIGLALFLSSFGYFKTNK